MDSFIQGSQGGFEFIPVHRLSEMTGASETGLKFCLSVLAGYPFSIIYNLLIKKTSSIYHHLYFTLCGLLISYFCFGKDTIHPMVTVLVTFVILVMFGGTQVSVAVMFIFQVSYLTFGYIKYSSDNYDINWTTPQCILCMRLIGLAWDCYDGNQKEEKLSSDQKTTCLDQIPSLVEISGYTFFYGGYLGPQFPFRRYMSNITGTLVDKDAAEKGPLAYVASLKRLMLSLVFLVLFTTLAPMYPTNYPASAAFLNLPLWRKCISLVIWNQAIFFKYLFVWLSSEGACILTGLTFNGKTEEGYAKWDGCKNISLLYYFGGYQLQMMVVSFNINTNQWVARYVFKRLRFLGNKNISHVSALMFLAFWHGFYVGYFICFAFEFVFIIAERRTIDILYGYFGKSITDYPLYIRLPLCALLAFYKWLFMAYAVVSFSLLRWRRIKPVYNSMYHFIAIISVVWYLSIPYIEKALKKPSQEKDKQKSS